MSRFARRAIIELHTELYEQGTETTLAELLDHPADNLGSLIDVEDPFIEGTTSVEFALRNLEYHLEGVARMPPMGWVLLQMTRGMAYLDGHWRIEPIPEEELAAYICLATRLVNGGDLSVLPVVDRLRSEFADYGAEPESSEREWGAALLLV